MNFVTLTTSNIVSTMPFIVLPFLIGFLAIIIFSIVKDSMKRRKNQRLLIEEKRNQERARMNK